VISEKSLSASVFEATELMNLSNQLHQKLYVTFNYTGYPMIREIKRRVEAGQIGNLHTVDIEMPQDGFIVRNGEGHPNNIQDWRMKDYAIPTVSLDLGVHVLSLIHFLTKSHFRKLVAVEKHSGIINKVVDNVHVIGQLQNGADATLSFGKVFSGEKNNISIRLYGDKGSIKWTHHQPDRFTQTDSHGESRDVQLSSFDLIEAQLARYNRFKAGHPTGFIEAFGNYYEDLRTALLGEDSSKVFAADLAVQGMKELDAMHTSASSSRWIDLDE
jgi:predicted dehydrogenase